MLTRRVLKEMFATALYFADQGARCGAWMLAGRGAIFGLLLGFLHYWGWGWETPFAIFINMANGAIWCCFSGFIIGLLWGGFTFFWVGFCQGIHPNCEREKETLRRRLAVQCAALYCGWAAALTGLAIMALQDRFQSFTATSLIRVQALVMDCLFYLFCGNIFGMAIGAFAPNAVEKAREAVKSLFASTRRV